MPTQIYTNTVACVPKSIVRYRRAATDANNRAGKTTPQGVHKACVSQC